MAIGFTLTTGIQEGQFNLNNNDIKFEILFNDLVNKYYISLYKEEVMLIGGVFLSNGTDILYNRKYLGLGTSLMYRGENDLSEGYLIYEV